MKADRRTVVRVAFADGAKRWPGYTTCSPHFQVARVPQSHKIHYAGTLERWQLIHVPTGYCAGWHKTLFEARMIAATLAGFPYNFGCKHATLAGCAKKCPWLMPWMRATNHVMYGL